MESISKAVETPPQNQIEGVPSDESCQFIGKPPKGLGGTQSGHQRKRGFRKRYRRSVQRGGNPSPARQSSGKGRARRSFESCTSYCQRLRSFSASMITWAQLKTLAIMISLMPLVKTTFGLCKVITKFCSSSYDVGSDFLQGK